MNSIKEELVIIITGLKSLLVISKRYTTIDEEREDINELIQKLNLLQ